MGVGHAAPPLFVGTPEEQIAQAQRLPFIQVRPLARLALTPTRVAELIGVLQGILDVHNSTFTGGSGA